MSKLLVLQGAVLHFSSCSAVNHHRHPSCRECDGNGILRKSYVTQSCSTTGCCAVLLPFPRPLPFHLGTSSFEKIGGMCSFVTTTSGFLRNTSCACTFASSSGSGLDVSIHKVSKSTKAVKQMLFMFPFLHLDISSQLSCICIKGILNTSSKHTLHLPSCSLRISLHFCHFAHLQRHIVKAVKAMRGCHVVGSTVQCDNLPLGLPFFCSVALIRPSMPPLGAAWSIVGKEDENGKENGIFRFQTCWTGPSSDSVSQDQISSLRRFGLGIS